MNFTDAVKEMKKGKKVRRKGNDYFCYLTEDDIVTTSNTTKDMPFPYISVETIESTDWEVVEEKQPTLSDKIIPLNKYSYTKGQLYVEDVQEFIKEIMNLQPTLPALNKIKELAGERLV